MPAPMQQQQPNLDRNAATTGTRHKATTTTQLNHLSTRANHNTKAEQEDDQTGGHTRHHSQGRLHCPEGKAQHKHKDKAQHQCRMKGGCLNRRFSKTPWPNNVALPKEQNPTQAQGQTTTPRQKREMLKPAPLQNTIMMEYRIAQQAKPNTSKRTNHSIKAGRGGGINKPAPAKTQKRWNAALPKKQGPKQTQ